MLWLYTEKTILPLKSSLILEQQQHPPLCWQLQLPTCYISEQIIMGKKHLEIKNTEFISSHMWLKLSSVDRITTTSLESKSISFTLKLMEGKYTFFLCHETKIP